MGDERKSRDSKKLDRRRRGKGGSMFYSPARWEYLGEVVTIRNSAAARGAVEELMRLYDRARSKEARLRILRVVVLAANRAEAASRRKNLSERERRELRAVVEIYREFAEKLKRELR